MERFTTLKAILLQLKKELAEGQNLIYGTKNVYMLKRACVADPDISCRINVSLLSVQMSARMI